MPASADREALAAALCLTSEEAARLVEYNGAYGPLLAYLRQVFREERISAIVRRPLGAWPASILDMLLEMGPGYAIALLDGEFRELNKRSRGGWPASRFAMSYTTLERPVRQTGLAQPHISNRIYRMAKVLALATSVLGDSHKALRWLSRPTSTLDGESPIDLLDSDERTDRVLASLLNIEHGVY